jgi:integral membrane sensor domain MASE1
MADAPTSIRRHSANTDWRMYGLQLAVLAAIYIFSGFIGLSLAHYQPNATLIWPPTGLSLAALIVYGPRLWPGVVIGSLALSLLNGSSLPLSLAICTGNTLEAVVGSIVLVRVFDFRPSLDRIRDVMALLLFGGMCATLSSASVGPLALWLLGNIETSQIGPVGLIWWLGDFGGVVVIAPLVLMLYYGNPSWPALFKRVEFWLASISLAGTCLVVFGDTFPQAWSGAIALIPAPFIVWAACRLGTRGAILASSATLLMPTVATGNGTGPFAVPDAQTSMILL